MNNEFSHMLADGKKDHARAQLVSEIMTGKAPRGRSWWIEKQKRGERTYFRLRWRENGARRCAYLGTHVNRERVERAVSQWKI